VRTKRGLMVRPIACATGFWAALPRLPAVSPVAVFYGGKTNVQYVDQALAGSVEPDPRHLDGGFSLGAAVPDRHALDVECNEVECSNVECGDPGDPDCRCGAHCPVQGDGVGRVGQRGARSV